MEPSLGGFLNLGKTFFFLSIFPCSSLHHFSCRRKEKNLLFSTTELLSHSCGLGGGGGREEGDGGGGLIHPIGLLWRE